MGVFSGLQEARSTQGGLYIKPGNYLVEIQNVKMQGSQVGNRQFFIVETKVIEAKKTDNETEPNGVDTEPSWLVELPGKYPELALGNIKNFLLAAYGYIAIEEGETPPEEEDIDESLADHAVSEDQPLQGVYLSVEAFQKETKSGGQFTRVRWSVPENASELVDR